MRSTTANVQNSPEESLKLFLASVFATTGIADVSELNEKLAATPVDERLKCLLSVRGERGENVIHVAAQNNMLEVAECICTHLGSEQFYKLVGQADENGCFPLHYSFLSVKSGVSSQSVEKMIDLLLGSFDSERRYNLIGRMIYSQWNLLAFAVVLKTPLLALKILSILPESDQVELLHAKDQHNDTALHWLFSCPDESDFTERLCHMIPHQDLVELLKKADTRGYTPLYFASTKPGNAFPRLLLMLSQQEVEYFAEKCFQDVPFLHHLAGCFDYLVLVINRLSEKVFLELMVQTDVRSSTLLHQVLIFDQVDAMKVISDRLSTDQLCEFLMAEDALKKAPLHYAAERKSWKVSAFLAEIFSNEQLEQLLEMQDLNGNSPFNSLVKKKKEEVNRFLLQNTYSYNATARQQQISSKETDSDTNRYESTLKYRRPDQPDVLSWRERTIRELEEEVQSKDFQLEALKIKTTELELEVKDLKRAEIETSHHTQCSQVEDQLEVISLRERISELEEEVKVKDSQLEGLPEVASLRKRISELEEQVQLKDSQLEEHEEKVAELQKIVDDREEEVARLQKLVDEDDSTDTTGSEPPGSPECDEDDESLEDYSKFDDHDIPEELHDDLVRLCEERQVAGFQFYQNPANFNEIVITGRNTSNFKPDDFENVRGDKWKEYTIAAEEEEMDCYTEQHTDIRQFAITQLKGTCELIVEALDANRKRRKYAVGSAHCMFPKGTNLQLQRGNNLVQARQDVQRNPTGKHYKIRFQLSPDQFKVIDAYYPPIFCYRYQHDRGDAADPSSFCLNNLVLL